MDAMLLAELVVTSHRVAATRSRLAKVAALYAQSSKDPIVVDAVSDIGQITTNLSNKIWQKITLVQRLPPDIVTA